MQLLLIYYGSRYINPNLGGIFRGLFCGGGGGVGGKVFLLSKTY